MIARRTIRVVWITPKGAKGLDEARWEKEVTYEGKSVTVRL